MGSSLRPIALAWLEQAGERRYVESETRIGRGEQNNIRLNHPSVSRDHAIIRRVEGTYVLSDLDSANGTFVNGERVYGPRKLAPGDQVRLASVEFTFNIDRVDVSPQEPPEPRLATSISQFLTMSGRIDPQNYLEGDLRIVTVLFLDLCGFTALSEKMSPEQITVVINQCFQHLTETATRHGGFVDKYIGDAMMVLFGAPRTRDDDAERAVRAAIAMQQALTTFSERLHRRSGITLQMRVGINTGEVLAGLVGSGQFSAFTVMGDTVNLASRLEESARVGHILVSDTTAQLTRDVVRYAMLPPADIKGKQEPVPVYEVQGLQDLAAPAANSVFVGRQTELGELAQLLSAGGGLRTAIVSGPAGSGKSRLIQELLRAHAAHVEMVRSADFREQGTRLITERLEQLAGALRNARMPAVVIVDRVDVADAETVAALTLFADQLTDADVLLIFTTRLDSVEVWPGNPRHLQLQPLGREELTQLMNGLLDSARPAADVVDQVLQWTNGWPGLVEDLVSAASSTGSLRLEDDVYHLPAGPSIAGAYKTRMLVQSKLDQLNADEKQVLWLASVLDEPWTPELLSNAADASSTPLGVSLDRLVALELIGRASGARPSIYDFRDPVTRAVVDASLPQLARRRLHERLALALQRAYDPGQPDPVGLKKIAMHFAAAGQHWRGVEYLLRSADLAAATASPRAAVESYRAVLAEAQTVSDSRERARLNLEVHERIGDALFRDGNLTEAQIAFEQAVDNSASDQRRAELQIKLGLTGARRGNHRRVLQLMESVLQQPNVAPETRATAEGLMAISLATQGSARLAVQHARAAVALASQTRDLSALGLARFAAGRAQLTAGRFNTAEQELQHSIAVRDQAGDRLASAESHILLGLVHCIGGDLPSAEASVRAAIATFGGNDAVDVLEPRSGLAETPNRWTLANAALVLARVVREQGDTSRAERHAASAVRISEALAARELALEARLELTALQVVQQSSPEATHEVQHLIEELRSAVDATLALDLGPLACRMRVGLAAALLASMRTAPADSTYAREAVVVARDALAHARKLDLPLEAANAHAVLARGLAQLGFWDHAEREFEAAIHELEALGAQVDLARALLDFARAESVRAPASRPGSLSMRIERAMQLADTLGMRDVRAMASRLLSTVNA